MKLNNDNRRLTLSDSINHNIVGDMIHKIHCINDEDFIMEQVQVGYEREPIIITINSYGGSVYDGFGLISAIETSVTPVHTIVFGSAMSMALAIAVSGHERFTHKFSTYMYHEVSNEYYGNLTSHRENVFELKRLQRMYDDYLLEKTKIGLQKLTQIKKQKKDWFFSAEEAMKYGLADYMLEIQEIEMEKENNQ